MTRKSKQRETILRILRGTASHPTADWIYEQARREMPNISLGTVYRNLRLLTQEGKITELRFNGNLSRFDANISDHDHFQCEQCGRIFDLDGPGVAISDATVARKTGFEVHNHRVEFHGLCSDCRSGQLTLDIPKVESSG